MAIAITVDETSVRNVFEVICPSWSFLPCSGCECTLLLHSVLHFFNACNFYDLDGVTPFFPFSNSPLQMSI